MSSFKPDQCRLVFGGRTFHFVSYEARPADPKRGEAATPAMWYLMVEGHRRPVFPLDADLPVEQLERQLREWLLEQNLSPVATPTKRPARSGASRQRRNWWGA